MEFRQEKTVTKILTRYYKNSGWVVFEEFTIPGTLLNFEHSILLRPDLFVFKNGVSMVIEVENAPFVHHPTKYVDLANYCLLAYPESGEHVLTQETVDEQLTFAKNQGIGVLKVKMEWGKVQVIELFPAIKREIHPEIKARIIHLAYKRYMREKKTNIKSMTRERKKRS